MCNISVIEDNFFGAAIKYDRWITAGEALHEASIKYSMARKTNISEVPDCFAFDIESDSFGSSVQVNYLM